MMTVCSLHTVSSFCPCSLVEPAAVIMSQTLAQTVASIDSSLPKHENRPAIDTGYKDRVHARFYKYQTYKY